MVLSSRIFAIAVAIVSVVGTSAIPCPPKVPHPTVYQVNTRVWLYDLFWQNGQKAVTIDPDNDPNGYKVVQNSLSSILSTYKPDTIWLMGVWSLGAKGLELDRARINDFRAASGNPGLTNDDVIGSPYAIAGYTANPAVGTDKGLKALKTWLNSQNIRLMLDFVPNHVAIDHPWACEQPDYLMWVDQDPMNLNCVDKTKAPLFINTCGKNIYYGGDFYQAAWKDTIQLNYWNPALREAQYQILRKVSSMADSIRVDMAMIVTNAHIRKAWVDAGTGGCQAGPRGKMPQKYANNPPADEFWATVIPKLKAEFPSLTLLAEGYDYGLTEPYAESQLLKILGFDYVYDIMPYKFLLTGKVNNWKLKQYTLGQGDDFMNSAVHFVENHDDNRAAGAKNLGGVAQAQAGAALAASLPGMRLFHYGQEACLTANMPVQVRKSAFESGSQACRSYFSKLIGFFGTDNVVKSGGFSPVGFFSQKEDNCLQFSCLDNTANVHGFKWTLGKEERLILVNYGETGSAVTVTFQPPRSAVAAATLRRERNLQVSTGYSGPYASTGLVKPITLNVVASTHGRSSVTVDLTLLTKAGLRIQLDKYEAIVFSYSY